jgi:hypothetical protein
MGRVDQKGFEMGVPNEWQRRHTVVSLLLVAAFIGLAIWAATSDSFLTNASGRLPVWSFIGLAVVLTIFIFLMGWAITGKAGGALIDPRKGRMSLSQLQILAWTVLIVAAYLNAFVVNVSAGRPDPLSVQMPGELLIAMGISITGLVGAKLVLGFKLDEHGNAVEDANGKAKLERQAPTEKEKEKDERSAIFKARRAQWRDIFSGDDNAGAHSLNLGKVQLFYITIALVVGYGIAVAKEFAKAKTGIPGTRGIDGLPKVDEAFVALLALSHAGYLTTKAAA